MAFVKLVKNNAYYKRYQTAFRRRREGKTDYYQRKRLIIQDKDKFNTPKYRLVARTTCSKVICQIIYSTLKGDRVLCQATSAELKKWNVTAGLTNYPASYCTGLLLARRLLKQLNMEATYKGVENIDAKDYHIEASGERRPFKAVLDIGLVHTTTGARVFGALKGAIDGGLQIPYSNRRFPGFTPAEEDEPDHYDPEAHRDRIFGVHVQKYMEVLKEEPEDYKSQFSKWDECLKKSGCKTPEELYKKVHKQIRATPEFKKATKKTFKREERKYPLPAKRLTLEQRQKNVKNKIKKMFKQKK